MAIYHADVKAFGRGRGKSGSAAAAYRAGVRITDPHTGTTYDYRRRHGVEGATMLAPRDAPAWARDIAECWARSDALATRKNARTAREVEVSLPAELTPGQRHALALDLGQRCVDRWGVGALVAEHAPARGGDQRNHHVHIQLTPRVVTREGFGERAMVEFDGRNGQGPAAIEAWRADIAATINRHLEAAGVAARVDHRTLADQAREALANGEVLKAGALARAPTQHEGKTNTAARRQGRMLDRAQANEATRADNVVSMRDWIQEHITAPAAVAVAEAAGKAAQADAPAQPAGQAAKPPAKKSGGGKAPAPRGGGGAPVRAGGGARGAVTKAHAVATKEQKAEAARSAEAMALINQSIAAAEAVAQEYLAGLAATSREVSTQMQQIAALAQMVAAQSAADLAATQRVLRAEIAGGRRCREIEQQQERAEQARKMVMDAGASKWRRQDRLETWRNTDPRPGVLHPGRRGAWDAKERRHLASIAEASQAQEKARADLLDEAALRSLERQAALADERRRETEAERDRVLGRGFAVGYGQRALARVPTSTDHSLDPATPEAPRFPARRLAAALATAQPPAPEPEAHHRKRRRRRPRPGGHEAGPDYADGSGE